MPGVVATKVGYTGGTNPNPTYESVCRSDGHTEALKLWFDPEKITYEQLMERYFAQYGRTGGGMRMRQYMSVVWVADEQQQAIAKRIAEKYNSHVDVLPASDWHDAEKYHQHYYDKMGCGCCGAFM